MELRFEPGASVAQVVQEQGVNANHVFKPRRDSEQGEAST